MPWSDWVTLDEEVLTEARGQESHISASTAGLSASIEIDTAAVTAAKISLELNAANVPTGDPISGAFLNVLSAQASRTVLTPDPTDDLNVAVSSAKMEMVVGLPNRLYVEADYADLAPAGAVEIEIENGGGGVHTAASVDVEVVSSSYDLSTETQSSLSGTWDYLLSIGESDVLAIPGGGVWPLGSIAGSGTITVPPSDLGGDFLLVGLLSTIEVGPLADPAFEAPASLLIHGRPVVTEVRATIQPPRARWFISETSGPVTENVTRLHPRDDGRGTSSAHRLFPQSKSERLVGGYQ
jgi:hypothetical protein